MRRKLLQLGGCTQKPAQLAEMQKWILKHDPPQVRQQQPQRQLASDIIGVLLVLRGDLVMLLADVQLLNAG